MQIFGPSGLRQTPLDRNPLPVHDGIDASFAGGTLDTTTVTYTCPAGRRARIESWSINAIVEVALAAGQNVTIAYEVTEPAPSHVLGGVRFLGGQALGTRDRATGGVVELRATGTLRLSINVAAGAGAMRVTAGFHGTEYDA